MKDKLFKHGKSQSSFFWKKFLIISCIVVLFVALVAVPVTICIHLQSNIHCSILDTTFSFVKNLISAI
ncbi:MAG TPA: hypothetical protein DDW20_00240 [Firmicutes bacterium]|nr:hypothetical protein [Bacillota bacterium]